MHVRTTVQKADELPAFLEDRWPADVEHVTDSPVDVVVTEGTSGLAVMVCADLAGEGHGVALTMPLDDFTALVNGVAGVLNDPDVGFAVPDSVGAITV